MSEPSQSLIHHQKGSLLRGFPMQFSIFILIPLTILVILVVVISQSLHHTAMQSLVGDRDLRAVQASAETISGEFLSLKENLLEMNELITLPGDLKAPKDIFNMLLKVNGGQVFLISANGQITAAAPGASTDVAACITALGFSARSSELQPGNVIYSDPVPFNPSPLILFGTDSPSGEMLVTAVPAARLFDKGLNALVRGDATNVMIFNSQHDLIYQIGKPPEEQHYSYHPSVLKALAGENGVNYPDGTHGSHVVAYSPIQLVGWALLVDEKWEDIATPTLNITQNLPLIFIPILILAIAALWFGTRQIVLPLQKLEEISARLGRGDFSAARTSVGGIAEIRHLQLELDAMANELEKARASLHHYAGALTEGIERERAGLSRELHDETLQGIIALKQRLQMETGKQQPDIHSFVRLQEMAQASIDNLRRVLRGLRPVYLDDLGLKVALEMLAKETSEQSQIPVQFEWQGEVRRLDPQIELAFYRIAQEALSNVYRHSGASHAELVVTITETSITLRIEDNGKGFVPPDTVDASAQSGHYGLLGMSERADLIGAQWTVESEEGRGTRVTLKFDK